MRLRGKTQPPLESQTWPKKENRQAARPNETKKPFPLYQIEEAGGDSSAETHSLPMCPLRFLANANT